MREVLHLKCTVLHFFFGKKTISIGLFLSFDTNSAPLPFPALFLSDNSVATYILARSHLRVSLGQLPVICQLSVQTVDLGNIHHLNIHPLQKQDSKLLEGRNCEKSVFSEYKCQIIVLDKNYLSNVKWYSEIPFPGPLHSGLKTGRQSTSIWRN